MILTNAKVVILLLFLFPTLSSGNPIVKWKYKARNPVAEFSMASVSKQGMIVVSDADELHAVSKSGKKIWSRKLSTGGWYLGSPTVASNGTILVGSRDSNLYAVNKRGKKLWSFGTGGAIESAPILGANGMIYVGSRDGSLYALRLDGSLVWRFQTDGDIESSPVIGSDGVIYTISWDNYCYAVNTDGTMRWKYYVDIFQKRYSITVNTSGQIIVGSLLKVYIINQFGTLDLFIDTTEKLGLVTGGIYYRAANGADGSIYVPDGEYLVAYSGEGNPKWEFKTGSFVSSPKVNASGDIFILSMDGNLYKIAANGTLIWTERLYSRAVAGAADFAPTLGNNGWIYAHGSIDGRKPALFGIRDR